MGEVWKMIFAQDAGWSLMHVFVMDLQFPCVRVGFALRVFTAQWKK